MTFDGGSDVDEIQLFFLEHQPRIAITTVDTEFLSCRIQPLVVPIAKRDDLCVRQLLPGIEVIICEKAATDQSDPSA